MLVVISPAKTLDFSPAPLLLPLTTSEMKDEVVALAKVTRRLKPADLKRLMSISDALAKLNHERFQAFDPELEDGLQAILAFNGGVYAALKARELSRAQLDWAHDHLRILSGLYGVLRPYDAIQPYRLEMGIRLKTRRGPNLYSWWGKRIAQNLDETLQDHGEPVILNAASQEYFGSVDRKALKARVVTCHFKEEQDDDLRVLSFYAKAARGLMARFCIEHRIDRIDDVRSFDVGGYRWNADLSTPDDWIFSRPQP
jgi:cytoplasmic iron level regulating protein YaaA (DUF328/UPF0246 family)